MTANSLKNSWEAIFNRRGGKGTCTSPFDSMDPKQRSTFLGKIELNTRELAVIGSMRDPNDWTALTTERLIWISEGQRQEVAVGDIVKATVDFKLLRSSESKLEVQTLQVTTNDGKVHSIKLEPGPPLSGFWNVLRNLALRNRRASSI